MKTGRPGAVELFKAIGTHSPASPCDPELEKIYIICFCQEDGVALNPRCTVSIRGSPQTVLGTYAEGSQTSKGKMQGPCGISRRNHVGLPAINARLSSRTEVLQL